LGDDFQSHWCHTVQGGHTTAPLQRRPLRRGQRGWLISSKWAAIAKCSPDTALRDITQLLELGVLQKTPGARVAEVDELAQRMAASPEGGPWVIILTGFGQADDLITKRACHRTGKVWEIQEGETESDLTARIGHEAFPDGKSEVMMVTRVK
jgi:hypothetical protein